MAKRNKFGIYDGCNLKVGGSALMEGVMMKNEDAIAMAVRTSDGEIKIIKKKSKGAGKKRKFSKLPFIRGAYNLFESMIDSVYYLTKSAEFIDLELDEKKSEEPSKMGKFLERVFKDKLMNIMMVISVIFSLLFSIGIFMLLPKVISELIGIYDNVVLKNAVEGLIRITLFVSYIFLSTRLKDIRRVFSYHGAEHKTIHCFEHNEELTVENVKKYSTLHPRCGTAFMFFIMLISILLFSFIDIGLNALNIGNTVVIKVFARFIFMPLLAGITYELTRFAMKSKLKIIRAINAPGISMQRITTYEPDDEMIEVAISSLKAVIDESVPFNTEEEIKEMIKASQGVTAKIKSVQESSVSWDDSENIEGTDE